MNCLLAEAFLETFPFCSDRGYTLCDIRNSHAQFLIWFQVCLLETGGRIPLSRKNSIITAYFNVPAWCLLSWLRWGQGFSRCRADLITACTVYWGFVKFACPAQAACSRQIQKPGPDLKQICQLVFAITRQVRGENMKI